MAMMSSKRSGFSLRSASRMPELSNWNTPVDSPWPSMAKVLESSSGMPASWNAGSRRRTSSSALVSTVSVFSPRKSNFTSPACSTSFMLNWVTGMSERGSR